MPILGTVGIADKGNYSAAVTYKKGNFVYYEGSSWLALKDNLRGVTPEEGENWKYLARGFQAELLSVVLATDTSGLIGTSGEQVGAQALMDKVSDMIATKVMMKSDLVSQIVNDATKAASMAALYSVNEELKRTNSNFELNIGVNKNIILKNNINGYAYIEDKDIHRNSVVIANSQGSIDNTQVHSVIVAGDGLAVVWFSSFNENEYGVNYRVLN